MRTAKLFDVTSVDYEESSIKDGENGDRSMWNLTFADKNDNHPIYITIKKGEIVYSKEEVNSKLPSKSFINISEITTNSLFYLNKAKNENHLMPGGNFAKGYHFVLAKGENTDPTISVYGTNINGYTTKIDFNAKTKSYLSSYSKLPSESGLYEYNKNKKTINIIEKNNAVLGSVFTKDLSTQAVWGYEKPGTINSTLFIRIKGIDSNGNWGNLDINERYINDLWFSEQFFNDKEIYYTTDTAIKSYNINNKQTKTLFQDSNQNNNILKIIHNSKSIVVLTQDHIYTSNNNGVNWDKVLSDKNISDIEFDENHNLYIKKQNEIYINNIDKDSKVNIPTLNEGINGYKVKNNFMYLYTNKSLVLICIWQAKNA